MRDHPDMDSAEIQAAFDDVFDQAILFHGFADYMRDYEVFLCNRRPAHWHKAGASAVPLCKLCPCLGDLSSVSEDLEAIAGRAAR